MIVARQAVAVYAEVDRILTKSSKLPSKIEIEFNDRFKLVQLNLFLQRFGRQCYETQISWHSLRIPPAVMQAVDTSVVTKYRGVPYKLQDFITESIPRPILNLKYRGIFYQIRETARDGIESITQPNPGTLSSIAIAILKANCYD